MKKDATIQIRISKGDKEKLKEISYFLDTTVTKMLTDYLDSIIKSGVISLYRTEKEKYGNIHVLSDEELSIIVGGAGDAIKANDYDLARNILSKLYDFKILIENKNNYINIRYDSEKKKNIEKIASKNNLNISLILDNYIKSIIYDFEESHKKLSPTKEEFEKDMTKIDEEIKNGEFYTLEESNNIFRLKFGDDFVDEICDSDK